jgi:NAD(P)-dependent dehydrogenase (short-subunit alcohol dehydrogenase family)
LHGRIDVIINNAGLMPFSPLERLKVDEWDRTIDVNVKGVLYGIAASATSLLAGTTIARCDPTEHDLRIEILVCGIALTAAVD